MNLHDCPPLPSTRPKARPPVDIDTWIRIQERKKPLDLPIQREYPVGVPRTVFHTVWRTPTERVPTMRINATDDIIVVSRAREVKPNEFLDIDPKSKKSVIQRLLDTGKTQLVELDKDDSLTGTIDRLRVAAKTVGKGVRLALNGDRKTARSFRFELIAPTVRVKKGDTSNVTQLPAG